MAKRVRRVSRVRSSRPCGRKFGAILRDGGSCFVAISRKTPQTVTSAATSEASSQIYVIGRGFRLVVRLLA